MKPSWNFFRRERPLVDERRRNRRRHNTVVRSDSFTLQFGPQTENNIITTTIPTNLITERVRYIFSTSLKRRPTSLFQLQKPLLKVYLAYMNNRRSSVPAVLDVRTDGLRCRHAKSDGSDIVDTFSRFESIAYWAALQCIVYADIMDDGLPKQDDGTIHLGFIPFSQDGQCLVNENLINVTSDFIALKTTERNRQLINVEHQPFFVCVKRSEIDQLSLPLSLQCHVFLCTDARQAVSLASNLYASLRLHISDRQLDCKQRRTIKNDTLPRSPPERLDTTDRNRNKQFSRILTSLLRSTQAQIIKKTNKQETNEEPKCPLRQSRTPGTRTSKWFQFITGMLTLQRKRMDTHRLSSNPIEINITQQEVQPEARMASIVQMKMKDEREFNNLDTDLQIGNDRTISLKKNAEIVSIIEQLVHYSEVTTDPKTDAIDTECSWGCSTFLP